MGNNKKIYLVVTVVAIAIALLSGTYSYFLASVSNTNVIAGTIASLALKLDVSKVTTGDNLIPLRESLLDKAASASCIDSNGYTACQVYKITLTNQGNVSVYVDGYITITSNTSINLKWTELSSATTYSNASTRSMARSELVTGEKLAPLSTKDYYIMVYLNDTNEMQNLVDKGSFNGLIMVLYQKIWMEIL